jgi:hypothetical protein
MITKVNRLPDPLHIGDHVRVRFGRWAGRVGTLTGTHYNPGNPGGQQGQVYPVVALDVLGRKKARTVRVVAVERIDNR